MLLSMTGQGDAQAQSESIAVGVELRTVNGRYFKLSVRGLERYSAFESRIETEVRKFVRRGTVQANFRIDRSYSSENCRLNVDILTEYCKQISEVNLRLDNQTDVSPESLVLLPGVVDEGASATDIEGHWSVFQQAVRGALANLNKMRSDEGEAMAADLAANCDAIAGELTEIETLAPTVAENYRTRVSEKLTTLLADQNVTVDASDVLKEVAIFAEKCDISEETVRLRSHLVQFATIMQEKESAGRKLDFLTQELFRETNTIGSKANNADIARHVIEIKTAIERIREMIQNVE